MDVEMDGDGQTLIEAEAMEAEPAPAIQDAPAPEPEAKEQDEWSGSFTWRIDNFSQLPEKKYSERFEVATYYWRLLVFPGNKQANQFSVYLDAPEAAWTPSSMSPKAKFCLHLHNQLDPTKKFSKDAIHAFTQNESDWGFTTFFTMTELQDPKNGWLVNDSVLLSVDLHVERDEKYNFDARKATGFVGLKNQGATCYMNSLLQYLYNLAFFRKAVYHMPTGETDEASKSLPLALQSLFYKLQYSKTHVSTKDLTKSFGWGTYDAFMQHDVQELNRVLCEKLEEKMKGTKVERVINELFEGHTLNFIECIHVDYKSSRKESFMDLQLDVKGCRDVYASFERYCDVELMDGPNQYKAEGHGLQDARKGVLFVNLPPVLQLQLKRFEYDFQRDTMVKINDRYEFPEELDLDFKDRCIFASEADKNVRNQYRLHSVLVHSGGVHGGHYYAFIRPDGQKWIRFDDDRVELVDSNRAVDDQFGGEDDSIAPVTGYPTPPLRGAKFSNAYMLVYVRVSDWPRLMSEPGLGDIAEHLRQRFQQEQEAKETRQKQKQEAHLYCTLKVATDADIARQVGTANQYFDLVNHDRLPEEHVFRVKKNIKFSEFKKRVEAEMGVPVAAQRHWLWSLRQNVTFRPSRPLTPEEEDHPLMELREYRDKSTLAKSAAMDLKLFLEVPMRFNRDTQSFEPSYTGALQERRDSVLLFVKFFDPVQESLRFVGRLYITKKATVKECSALLCTVCGLQAMVDIEVYEEIKYEPTVNVAPLDPKQVISTAGMEDGDIIIVQRRLRPEECASCRFPTVDRFLEYVRNRRLVTFKKLSEPKEEGVQLELLRDMDYDQVTTALAAKLQLPDPERLRLTMYNTYTSLPQKAPLRFRDGRRLEQVLVHAQHQNDILFYEVLDMPLGELEKLKVLRVAFFNESTEYQGEHQLRLPKACTVENLLGELRKQLGATVEGKKLRLLQINSGKVYAVFAVKEGIDHVNDSYWTLRAEPVPEPEVAIMCADNLPPEGLSEAPEALGMNVSASERLLQVCHMAASQDKEASSSATFGDPFFMPVDESWTMANLKKAIKERLAVSDEEFAKWKFAFCTKHLPPESLGDEDTIGQVFIRAKSELKVDTDVFLGMQHENMPPRRPVNNSRLTFEKAVKIYS